MTVSSMDIHNVTEITVDEVRDLEEFNSIIHSRHIKVRCKDQYGHIHTHTIMVYGDTISDLEIKK